jgi:hypothetical protein
MTALTTSRLVSSRSYESPRRIWSVVRLHFVNKFQILYTPLIALGGIFLLNLAIWWLIIEGTGGFKPSNVASQHLGYSGAVSYIFVYMLIVAVQSISRTFPFSLGFGVTRRDFYLGSALAFVILSIFFAIVLTIMSVLEVATSGWGMHGAMFAPTYFTNQSWLLRFVMYLLVFLFFLFVGSAAASVFVRWRATGLIVFFAIIAVIIVAAIAVLTLGNDWPGLGNYVGSVGALGVVLWTLVPTAISAIAGFFILRRATPRN